MTNHYATIRTALESIRSCDDDIGERDAALSAIAELERAASVVVGYQYWHGDCWRGKQTWNGNDATVSRALYAAPPIPTVAPSAITLSAAGRLEVSYRDEVMALYSSSREALDMRHFAAHIAARADAEIAELRRDAERYRWLRDKGGNELDAAIDAARGGE